jgi:hypothetical protein
LFWDLIEDQDWHDESVALAKLRAGAAAVNFQQSDDVVKAQTLKGSEWSAQNEFSRSIA